MKPVRPEADRCSIIGLAQRSSCAPEHGRGQGEEMGEWSTARKLGIMAAVLLAVLPCEVRLASAQESSSAETTAETKPVARFRKHVGGDIDAEPMEQFEAASTVDCELSCRRTQGCVAFSHDVWNQLCFLKSSATELQRNARTISGVLDSLPDPIWSSKPIVLEYFNDKTFPPFGFRAESASNRDQCGDMCLDDNRCVAFSYVVKTDECRIYDKTSEYVKMRGVKSGAKRQ
jgi:hypothetical protein